MKVVSSPLRYPGGKAKLYKFIETIIESNDLENCTYVEPYAGGASIGLMLLKNRIVQNIVINDLDRSIYSFWYSVLNHTEEFCSRIQSTRVSMTQWRLQKEVQKNKEKASLFDLGFSTFFLNRTNRSGILKAGVIGGLKQDGKWKINARYNKIDLINRIKQIAQYRAQISLYNLDACVLIDTISKKTSNNTFFYFDPPYYIKGPDLYINYYKTDDHVQVANKIKTIPHKWIVTYDCVDDIKQIYSDKRQIEYILNYTAAKASKGKEIAIFSDNVAMPAREDLRLALGEFNN